MAEKDDEQNNPERNWQRIARLKVKPIKVKKHITKAEAWTKRHTNRFIVKRLRNLRDARREIVGWFMVVVVIIAGIGLQSYLYIVDNKTAASDAGGSYSEGIVGSISTLNPIFASSAPEVAASKLMFSSLYDYDRSGTLSPDAAVGTDVNDTGTTYTVHMRKDIKWQDGQPLTARDVAYTIDLIQDPNANVPTALSATWQGVKAKQLDDYTIQFTLPAYAGFMGALTFPILPAHILQDQPSSSVSSGNFALNPVGSGPFEFKLLQNIDSSSGEKSIHMIANTAYYGRTVKLDRFAIHSYPSADALAAALKSSEVTAAVDLDYQIAEEAAPKNYNVSTFPIDDGVYLIFNTTQPNLDDVHVRKAIQLALNPAAVREVAGGNVRVLDLPIISPELADAARADTQNIASASQLLDKAGWKLSGEYRAKKGKTLEFRLRTIDTPQFERVAKLIAEQLHAAGIKLDVSVFDTRNHSTNFVQSVLQPRDYDMLLYELVVGADPDQFAYWHSSQRGLDGYNFANYSNVISDAALATARDRLDPVLRRAKYLTFVKQWLKDVPAVGLYQQTLTYTHIKKISALDNGTNYVTAADRYDNIYDWSVTHRDVYKTP